MARKVTLFTGQWADLPLATLAKKAKEWGYDGLELACWGDHFDPNVAANDEACCEKKKLLAGQLVCDPNDDERTMSGLQTNRWVHARAQNVTRRRRRLSSQKSGQPVRSINITCRLVFIKPIRRERGW